MVCVREHPIRVLSRISHFVVLLIVPVLRALLFSGGSLQQWLLGVWIDLLVLIFMVGCGFLAWLFDVYCISSDGIEQFTGIFRIKKTYYPIKLSTVISLEQPWYLSMFGAARLCVDTAASSARKCNLNLVVNKKTVQEVFHRYAHVNSSRKFYSSLSAVFGVSVLSSSGFTGMIFCVTFISQFGKIFGNEFEQQVVNNFTKTMEVIVVGVPPAAAILSGLIAIGWLVSFTMNLIQYSHFFARRRGRFLNISNGAWPDRNCYYINTDKVNLLLLQQTLTTRLLRLYTAYLFAIGYGKRKNQKAILIPTMKRKKIDLTLEKLFPELTFSKKQIQPLSKNFRKFLWIPIIIFAAISVFSFAASRLLPAFSGLIIFVGIMLLLVDSIYLSVRILSFFHTGAAYKNGIFSAYYTRGFKFRSVCFSKKKLVLVEIRQTFFQKRANCCSLIFYTYGVKQCRHIVSNVELLDAEQLLAAALL